MDLVHCVYFSAATAEMGPRELEALLATARRNNERLGLTGMLLYQGGSFFQVLEGDRPCVDALLEKVARDPRHARFTKLIEEPISERSFGEWKMAFPKISPTQLATTPGLSDFFSNEQPFFKLTPGRARSLLLAFRAGKWHSAL